MAQGGLFKGKSAISKKKQMSGGAKRLLNKKGPKVGGAICARWLHGVHCFKNLYWCTGRKNAKKSDLMKAKNAHNHWGGQDGVEATKLINAKNEDNLQAMVRGTTEFF